MSSYSSVTFFPHSGNTILIFNLLADMWALRSQGIIFFAPANDIRISYSEYVSPTCPTGNHMIGGVGSYGQWSTSCPLRLFQKQIKPYQCHFNPMNIGNSGPPIKMWCGNLIGIARSMTKDWIGDIPTGLQCQVALGCSDTSTQNMAFNCCPESIRSCFSDIQGQSGNISMHHRGSAEEPPDCRNRLSPMTCT